jgi:hypothetical protein
VRTEILSRALNIEHRVRLNRVAELCSPLRRYQQFALEVYHGGFLAIDGHHNRLLSVKRNGSIKEIATIGNGVPTGLEVAKGRGRELVLDRPTSMEFVGDTAYFVSVVGDVYKIKNL